MPTSLTLDTTRCDDETRADRGGGNRSKQHRRIDQALTTAVAEAVGSGGKLTVDLSAVEYLDSSAISALAARADHINLTAHPLLMSVLTISGLSELVTIEPAPPTAEQ